MASNKNTLQEYLQLRGHELPKYASVFVQSWTSVVTVLSIDYESGHFASKKQAEQDAARIALLALGTDPVPVEIKWSVIRKLVANGMMSLSDDVLSTLYEDPGIMMYEK